MKITMLVHGNSWFKRVDAERFLPVLTKHAGADNIFFKERPDEPGDIMFALHYPALIKPELLLMHKANIVIHAADLPKGRGRSPIHWEVEAGSNSIVLSLFEMGDQADNGPVYLKSKLVLDGTELLDEIREKVIRAEVDMVDAFLSCWPSIKPDVQQGEPSYYPKRTRENQRLDVNMTIAEQFNKMRVADNELYPLWFEHQGATYSLKIFKQ
jgi:methionyl-tRNA formyltransferase